MSQSSTPTSPSTPPPPPPPPPTSTPTSPPSPSQTSAPTWPSSADIPAEFAGLRAVVTGGGSGIGAATVSALRERGARVMVFDRDGDAISGTPDAMVVDVADDASVGAGMAATLAEFSGLDIVVNNAGIGAAGTVEDNPDDEWARVFDVNVFGMVRVSRAALPALRQSAHASIVNTCSVAATAGIPRRALYGASKGAVWALTMAMAADHVGEGIRVNCVNPGTAATPWVGRLLAAAEDPAHEEAALNARQPMGRLVTAEEVASAILYLAGPSAGATTATALYVDGGMQNLRMPPRRP